MSVETMSLVELKHVPAAAVVGPMLCECWLSRRSRRLSSIEPASDVIWVGRSRRSP